MDVTRSKTWDDVQDLFKNNKWHLCTSSVTHTYYKPTGNVLNRLIQQRTDKEIAYP